jgi:signal recognition particle receptor subunit beta
MDQVERELLSFLSDDQLRDVSVLVIANKQDLPNAQSQMVIAEKLKLHAIRQNCRESNSVLYVNYVIQLIITSYFSVAI